MSSHLEVGSHVIFEVETNRAGYGPYYYAGRLAVQLPTDEWLIQPNNRRMGVHRSSLEKIWLAPEFMNHLVDVDHGDD